MEILTLPIGGFIVIFLASLLLFGELLVNTRGFFALVGTALFVLYFLYFVSPHSLIWIIALWVFGIIFIILDGKLINNGSVAVVGLIMVMVAIALPTPSLVYAVIVCFAYLLGLSFSFLFLKVFKARKFWSKIALMYQLSSDQGYISMNRTYSELVGKQGVTVTPFRPTGTIEVNGKHYSATTNDLWLEAQTKIIVVSVDGTKIVVNQHKD